MFDSLLSIESIVALSIGAIFSFKIGKVNISIKNNFKNQSPEISGNNNLVIYNQAMGNVRKEVGFSIKISVIVMMFLFHWFPNFFLNLLISFSFFLPIFSLLGIVNVIWLNGIYRGWDFLYFVASLIMGVLFYCSASMMTKYISIYPELTTIYAHMSEYKLMGLIDAPHYFYYFMLVIMTSIACPALIIMGLYLAFAYTKARDGNEVFRYASKLLLSGYVAYLFISGVFFSPDRANYQQFLLTLAYPFKVVLSFFV
ncbi:hypothetical protein [Proteus mirabilis]|uniref:hypothetical protein n=1 Tax=Proteus mirabilis TaxID=584 RepID=UPI0018C5FAD2|nr:hypothetical protein [Proteus mirabilis]